MKKVLFVLAFLLASASVTFAQRPMISMDVVLGHRQPTPSEQSLMTAEELNHPNITAAMRDMEHAMAKIKSAPNEFGTNKAQAEADLWNAYVDLRKALYFRLYTDTH